MHALCEVTKKIFHYQWGRYSSLTEKELKYHKKKLVDTLHFLHMHSLAHERRIEETNYKIFWSKAVSIFFLQYLPQSLQIFCI